MLYILLCCFGLLGFCVADDNESKYMANVKVMPSVVGDEVHHYISEVKCAGLSGFTETQESFVAHPDGSDYAPLPLGNDQCPAPAEGSSAGEADGFQVSLAMFTTNEEEPWSTWLSPIKLNNIKFEGNATDISKKVELGKHFKLNITPNLADESKIVYRVNVYRNDNGRLIFKTYAKAQKDINVVFNFNYKMFTQIFAEWVQDETEQKNDPKKDPKKFNIKVWPTYEKWVHLFKDPKDHANKWENELHQTEFIANGITVRNGQTYSKVNFPCHFTLLIEPVLNPEEESIYYAKVKCSRKNSYTFKTFTHGKTQIILNEKGCKIYYIALTKLDKEIDNFEEIKTIRPKMIKISQPITNGSAYPIKYNESEAVDDDAMLSGEEDKIEEDEDVVGSPKGRQVDDDEEFGFNLDEIIEEVEREMAEEKKNEGGEEMKQFNLDDGDDDEDDDGDEDEDEDGDEEEEDDEGEQSTPAKKMRKTTPAGKGKMKIMKDVLDGFTSKIPKGKRTAAPSSGSKGKKTTKALGNLANVPPQVKVKEEPIENDSATEPPLPAEGTKPASASVSRGGVNITKAKRKTPAAPASASQGKKKTTGPRKRQPAEKPSAKVEKQPEEQPNAQQAEVPPEEGKIAKRMRELAEGKGKLKEIKKEVE